jgi:hypothetical protein
MTYPSETKTVNLQYAVQLSDRKITALDIRRPKVRDQMIADKQNQDAADKEIHLMSLLANVEPSVIHELDMVDYEEVQKVIVNFRKKKSGKETCKEV